MREYEPKYPLEALDRVLYPNLLRDGNSLIISENITWFRLDRIENRVLVELELKVKKYCTSAELAYSDVSGNRWIFLISNGNLSKKKLEQVQRTYEKMCKVALGALSYS